MAETTIWQWALKSLTISSRAAKSSTTASIERRYPMPVDGTSCVPTWNKTASNPPTGTTPSAMSPISCLTIVDGSAWTRVPFTSSTCMAIESAISNFDTTKNKKKHKDTNTERLTRHVEHVQNKDIMRHPPGTVANLPRQGVKNTHTHKKKQHKPSQVRWVRPTWTRAKFNNMANQITSQVRWWTYLDKIMWRQKHRDSLIHSKGHNRAPEPPQSNVNQQDNVNSGYKRHWPNHPVLWWAALAPLIERRK